MIKKIMYLFQFSLLACIQSQCKGNCVETSLLQETNTSNNWFDSSSKAGVGEYLKY